MVKPWHARVIAGIHDPSPPVPHVEDQGPIGDLSGRLDQPVLAMKSVGLARWSQEADRIRSGPDFDKIPLAALQNALAKVRRQLLDRDPMGQGSGEETVRVKVDLKRVGFPERTGSALK